MIALEGPVHKDSLGDLHQALPRWLGGTLTLLAPALKAFCVGMAAGTETGMHRSLRSTQSSSALMKQHSAVIIAAS